jgi:hypothetical protein
MAWVLLLVGLLVGLVVGGLVAGSWRSDLAVVVAPSPTPTVYATDVAPLPTGIEVITPDHGAYSRVVADGTGILWARDPDGRLVRYDPVSAAGRAWTVGDDASFGTTDIAGARAGGVWLIGAGDVRRFDGRVFRQVIRTPGEVSLLAEVPDGGLWAVMADGRLLRWDGAAWSDVDAGRPTSRPASGRITALAVDGAGRPWLGWTVLEYNVPRGRIARRDGPAWMTWDESAAAPLGGGVAAILPVADGTAWVMTTAGLARFDGTTWSDVTAGLAEAQCSSGWACPRLVSWAAGPDGAIWAAGEAGPGSPVEGFDLPGSDVIARRFDGASWTGWGSADGLPSLGDVRQVQGSLPWTGLASATVLPVPGGTFVGTADGIYRLADERWERAWPGDTIPTGALEGLLAVSRDELWAIGDRGVWHYDGGAWTAESIDAARPSGTVADLALAPDGTLWAAGSDGVAYRRDGRWTVADPTAAGGIAFGPDGTAWVVGRNCRIWTLRSSAAGWVRTALGGCPLMGDSTAAWTVAVDGRGVTWVGGRGFGDPGLARYAGGRWETIDAIDGAQVDGTTVLGTTPTGEPWIVLGQEAARFDGTAWQVTAPPGYPAGGFTLAVDGFLWIAVRDGTGATRIARLDGGQWTYPYPGVELPMTSIAAAPDGTVFAVGSEVPNCPTVVRLPARPATPTPIVTPSAEIATPAPSPSVAPSAPADSMTHERSRHTATLLEDGRVLITGGDDLRNSYLPASAELFDPVTGTFAPTGSLASKNRAGHTAIRLADGRVLLVGGMPYFEMFWREIWDPATGMFTTPGGNGANSPKDGSYVMAAGPLPDGRILVQTDQSPTAELYDPSSGAETEVGPLESDPRGATATLLQDGRVLIVGGATTVFHVYDPRTGEFTAVTGAKLMGRAAHTATLLADGRVLLVGGPGTGLDYGAFAEIYDPTTGTVRPTGSMITPRAKPVATLLADGRVLVTGGGTGWYGSGEALASAELYDPATGTFSPTGSMGIARTGHTATLLRDGTVLIAGGIAPDLGRTATAELYDPATGTFSPVGGR